MMGRYLILSILSSRARSANIQYFPKDTLHDPISPPTPIQPRATKESMVKASKAKAKAAKDDSKELHACSVCDYSTHHKGYMSRHMKSHQRASEFRCGVCQYICSRKSSLVKHMRIHNGEKPYTCGYAGCNFRAAQRSNVTVHQRIHNQEKPFACTWVGCSFRCSRKFNLANHMRTHTREKPFSCTECNYKAARCHHLKNHMRTHTKGGGSGLGGVVAGVAPKQPSAKTRGTAV